MEEHTTTRSTTFTKIVKHFYGPNHRSKCHGKSQQQISSNIYWLYTVLDILKIVPNVFYHTPLEPTLTSRDVARDIKVRGKYCYYPLQVLSHR